MPLPVPPVQFSSAVAISLLNAATSFSRHFGCCRRQSHVAKSAMPLEGWLLFCCRCFFGGHTHALNPRRRRRSALLCAKVVEGTQLVVIGLSVGQRKCNEIRSDQLQVDHTNQLAASYGQWQVRTLLNWTELALSVTELRGQRTEATKAKECRSLNLNFDASAMSGRRWLLANEKTANGCG